MIRPYSYILACSTLLLLPACFTTAPSCKWPQMKKTRKNQSNKSHIIAIATAEEFTKEVIESKTPVMVKFFAKWCSACKVMEPRVNEIAEELHPDYKIVSVDVDILQTIATKYLIKGIPAFLFFKNGKQINKDDNVVGVIEKDKLKNQISKAFAQ